MKFITSLCLVLLLFIACTNKENKETSKQENTEETVKKAETNVEVKLLTEAVTELNNSEHFNALTNSTNIVLVDFYADWCKPCKMLSPILHEIATENSDKIKILKVDVDKFPELANKYKVRGIPHLIAFKEGESIWKGVGFQEKESLTKSLGL